MRSKASPELLLEGYRSAMPSIQLEASRQKQPWLETPHPYLWVQAVFGWKGRLQLEARRHEQPLVGKVNLSNFGWRLHILRSGFRPSPIGSKHTKTQTSLDGEGKPSGPGLGAKQQFVQWTGECEAYPGKGQIQLAETMSAGSICSEWPTCHANSKNRETHNSRCRTEWGLTSQHRLNAV